jgi:hypothetical protein
LSDISVIIIEGVFPFKNGQNTKNLEKNLGIMGEGDVDAEIYPYF